MSLNILIVEDEAITALDIKRKLEYWGYNVLEIAHKGSDAIEFALKLKPDLILMDIILRGELDGIETAGEIKKKCDIPVIYLTAHSEEKIMERAKYTEPYGYLIKPIDDKELFFALESAIYKFKADAKLKKVNRALRMISDCNQSIVRIKDKNELLNEICRLIVEEGGYYLAWVGMAQDDEFKSIQPVAQYGFDKGFLEKAKISWGNNKYSTGPAGKSIKTSKISIFRNLTGHPDFGPWKEEARARKYNSAIALPLFVEEKVLGCLSIYSSEIEAYDENEIDLLQELAGDISYYLESLKTKKEKENAIKKLEKSEEKLKDIINNAPFGAHSYEINDNGNLIFINANHSADTILNIDHQILFGKPVKEAFPGLENSSLPDIYYEIALKGGTHNETQINYQKGQIDGIFEINAVNTGKNKMTVFFRDVTESKKAEMALQSSEEKYRNIVETSNEGIWSMDENFQTTFVNRKMAQMLGYEISDMTGKSILDFMFEEDYDEQKKRIELRKKGISQQYSCKFLCQNGDILWALVSATPLKDKNGEFKGSFAMFTNLNEIKSIIDELKLSNYLF